VPVLVETDTGETLATECFRFRNCAVWLMVTYCKLQYQKRFKHWRWSGCIRPSGTFSSVSSHGWSRLCLLAFYYAFCHGTLTPINQSIHFYLYLFVIVDQRSVWYKSMSSFEDFRRKKEVVFKYLVFRTPSSSQHSTTMTAMTNLLCHLHMDPFFFYLGLPPTHRFLSNIMQI
jgi:hypothetical protein